MIVYLDLADVAQEVQEHDAASLAKTHSGGLIAFMDLPTEVRQGIYSYLFLHEGTPICIGTKYTGLKPFEPAEPTFQTQVFRLSKEIHRDAIAYAYGMNEFVLRDTFPAFCGLNDAALASIKDLTVVHSSWTAEHEYEDRGWEVIQHKCVNLRRLELDLHADLVLEAVPFLWEFLRSFEPEQKCTALLLDLYVWERHFSFDSSDREYRHSSDMIRGVHQKSRFTPRFVDPKARVARLPTSVETIILSADVGQGAIQALDSFLHKDRRTRLFKEQRDLPRMGRRACGRSARYSYVWKHEQTEH